MLKSKDLRKKQDDLLTELVPLANKKASELTDAERTLWVEKQNEYSAVNAELLLTLQQEEVLRASAEINGRDLSAQDNKDIEGFSFRKLFLALADGRALDGVELEMHQEAEVEAKAQGHVLSGTGIPLRLLNYKQLSRVNIGQNVGTAAEGGFLKQEEPLVFFEALRNALMLPGMGANFLTNLQGDLPLVQGGQFMAAWLAEGDLSTTTKVALGKVTLVPKRVQATGAFSRKLLVQSSVDIETMLTNELIMSIAHALQLACINGAGTNEPLGILNVNGIGDVAGGIDGAIPTWGNIVDLESKIAVANGNLSTSSYLTNAKVRGKLKQIVKAASTAEFIWKDSEMNGYKANTTNAVSSTLVKGTSGAVCSTIIFADWSKFFIGQWGGLDVIVDPYTLKKNGEIEITVISQYDSAPVWPVAFAAMKDALTT